MKLSEAIEALCVAARANRRSPRTVDICREKLSYLVAFLGADAPVDAITTADLRRYVASLWYRSGRDASAFTVSTRSRAVRRLFNWLQAEGITDHNPAQGLEVPKPRRTAPKGVGVADVRALLATCEGGSLADLRDRAAMCFLFDTGCRAGGLSGLQLDDLDIKAGLALVTEKGERTRYVMFGPQTAEALRAWLAVRPKDRRPWVFVSLKGKARLSPSGLWQAINRRARRAGIEGSVSVHGFRHAFARGYLMSGGDLGSLADILGHSDIRTTADYYGVFSIQELQRKHREHSPMSRLFDWRNDEGDSDTT
ncbi:MAG: tyrosine-type recombinase/integrase [Anaerolineales bacterium]|nr:tyrosine-type recombinase/integrase [Anaerolineales bacterium]